MIHRQSLLAHALYTIVTGLAFLGLTRMVSAESREYQQMPAKLFSPRDGLGNVAQKLAANQKVNIAYLGGSITAANGWRVKTFEWFKQQYPQADIHQIHAAIGGTGSDLGVFRVQRDALQHNPDLLFVEFAVNDGGAAPERIWRSMEGIVRQAWEHNPKMDICFVYTYRVGYESDLRKELCPRAASAMEQLANFYRIPSVNFALKVVELEQAGNLVFQADQPPQEDLIHFSKDGVHPLDAGHQIYADVFAEAFQEMKSSPPVNHADQLKTVFVEDNWQAAKMVPIKQEMLSHGWKKLPSDSGLVRSFGKRMGELWEATEPGDRLTFKFRGSTAKLYDLLGPDGGQVIITVDGETRAKPIPRFDSYCTYHRIATLTLADGLDPQQTHTVSIEVHPDQPDRTSVAFRLKNPDEELKASKYQGTRIRVGQILVLGEVVE